MSAKATIDQSLETFKEAKQRVTAAREEAKRVCKKAFKDGAKQLFASHPILKSFSWTQYTPYFNDGDACVFSAYADCPSIAFVAEPDTDAPNEEDDEDEWGSWDAEQKRKQGKPLTAEEEAGLAVVDFLSVFDNDDYLDCFGDHVKVTVTRQGIKVNEYSHD